MSNQAQDINFMRRALQLAAIAGVNAAPNPMVGAVIVHNGKIIGEGFHQKYGEPHAEVNAINSVVNKTLLSTSTMYVTLEPCSHYGKTPPCADLIIKHKLKRVVIACKDTFSKVAGMGIKKLQDEGIDVTLNVLEEEARELNKRFFTYHEKKRPYVILKWAQTNDGFIDKERSNHEKGVNWITQPETKTLVHSWRAQEQAILVGWKTVANDNPSLTVRNISGVSPHRFVIDPNFKIPKNSKIITDNHKTTIITLNKRFNINSDTVDIVEVEDFTINSVLNVIYQKQFLSVFIEGGAYTLSQFIDNDVWDEINILQGNVNFLAGLPAPKININPTATFKIGNDKHLHYSNL